MFSLEYFTNVSQDIRAFLWQNSILLSQNVTNNISCRLTCISLPMLQTSSVPLLWFLRNLILSLISCFILFFSRWPFMQNSWKDYQLDTCWLNWTVVRDPKKKKSHLSWQTGRWIMQHLHRKVVHQTWQVDRESDIVLTSTSSERRKENNPSKMIMEPFRSKSASRTFITDSFQGWSEKVRKNRDRSSLS